MAVDVRYIGSIAGPVGELVLAVLAQIADMEKARIKDRCDSGRAAARASIAATGRTQHGKVSLGRPQAADAAAVVTWRRHHGASIKATAVKFGTSEATVKRYCAAAGGEGAMAA